MTSAPRHIAERLYRARERRGWSLRQAGDAAGVSEATVFCAEQGRDIRVTTLIGLAGAYGLSLDALAAEPECGRCLDAGPCTQCGGTNGRTISEKEPSP